MVTLLLARWRLLAALTGAMAAFGAGWTVNGWRIGAERAAEAEDAAEALEAQLEATQAAEARLVALRGDYTKLQERLDAIPDNGDCGLDTGRVRILDELR